MSSVKDDIRKISTDEIAILESDIAEVNDSLVDEPSLETEDVEVDTADVAGFDDGDLDPFNDRWEQ